MKKKLPTLTIPEFKTEAEEAHWWDSQEDRVQADFEEAEAEGRLGRGTVARTAGITPTTTIRLDPEDISRARVQAAHKGLRYQTYLKMLIHEALQTKESK
jgi:predicted DNA binding CopG/RHH family protein